MRFSPTLLACCTAATLFGLPVFAADATDVAESSTTDAMADDTALTTDIDEPTGQLPETVDVQIAPQQQPADGAVALVDGAIAADTDSEALEPTPDELQIAQDPTETPEETLDRLLEGIGRPAEPLPVEEPEEELAQSA